VRRAGLILIALASAAVITVAASASKHEAPVMIGTVSAVPAGDTVVVSVKSTVKKGNKKVTVTKHVTAQILGVKAPTGSACFAAQSQGALSALALGKRVVLGGDPAAGATVSLPGGVDLASALLKQGAAQVDSWRPAFAQLTSYIPLQEAAAKAGAGMWSACAADIGVSVTGKTSAFVGEYIPYTVTVSNAGPLAAPSVTVELRPGNYAKLIYSVKSDSAKCSSKIWVAYCTIANLGSGASSTITIVIWPSQPGGLSARAVATLVACDSEQCGGAPLQDPNLLNDRAAQPTIVPGGSYGLPGHECDPSYPTVCLPPPPPDLDCADIAPLRDFPVDYSVPNPDQHHLDGDHNGIACQGDDY
jgi:endonuclease YncB( thermonuclease family)